MPSAISCKSLTGNRDHRRFEQTPRLHMIGNAHLDPGWLWRWPEGCAEAIGACWAAVDMLEENPEVIFTRGEAHVYRWIEEMEPAIFARIRELVRAGRWAIVNGWWVQPDCNLPSGEAFIRQALYGKAYPCDAAPLPRRRV